MKSIAQQLREHIWARGLSLQYGAGKIVAAHLSIREKTARSQLASLTNLRKAPETIVILERLCEALGLEITIKMKLTGIYFECTKDAHISAWAFDPPKLKAGEVAQVTQVIVAAENPMYLLAPENGDKPFVVHRNEMLKYGQFVNR